MKKWIVAIAAALPALGLAQQTKNALEKFAAQMQGLKTVAMDFEYYYESAADNTSTRQQGQLLISDKMYRLDWGESVIYFNGQLRWTYLKSVNEVTINTPNALEDGIFSDPSMLFSFDPKDYRPKQHGDRTGADGKAIVEIDLFPKDSKADYIRINLQLDKATLLPESVAYYGKNGGNVAIKIQKIDRAVKPTPADFTFDVKKRPGVEVVDMR
ncbi:MAG: outer membrane lipoprotein carrier protein LolA [Prevotellaceae bacterium]|jgi:outer membrane lipoprotein-sorting protein|nr:outer membrane lipoprotein carrier protein LolA [Prevotellaceae bacterium]